MKKFLAVLLACGLVFSFAGCGTKGKSEDIEKKGKNLTEKVGDYMDGETDEEELSSALDDYQNSIDGNIKGYDDIEEYIKASTSTEEFKKVLEHQKSIGLTLTVEADGDDMVYKYQYTVEVTDDAAQLLQESFEQNEDRLAQTADIIRIEAPCIDEVVWEYYSIDGELLASYRK